MVLNKFPRTNGEVIDADDMNQSFYQGTFSPNLNYGSVSVGTTATTIRSSDSNRKSILVRNNGGDTVEVGSSTLSSDGGIEILPSESILINDTAEVQAKAVSGTQDIRYLETTL